MKGIITVFIIAAACVSMAFSASGYLTFETDSSAHTKLKFKQNEDSLTIFDSELLEIMSIEEPFGERLHFPGYRTGYTSYYLDGMPVPNPFYGHGFQATELNPFAIQQVDLKNDEFDVQFDSELSNRIHLSSVSGSSDLSGFIRLKLSNPGSALQLFSGSASNVQLSAKPDYLRNKREWNAAVSGPVPFTNKAVTFFISGHYGKRAADVYQFDNLVYHSDEANESEYNSRINRLDTIAGWRGMGYIDSWNIFSKLLWQINSSTNLSLNSWNVSTASKRFGDEYDSRYLYNEQGLNQTLFRYDRQSFLFAQNISEKLGYNIRAAHSYQKTQVGNTLDGTAGSRFLKNDEYEAPGFDSDYETNKFWMEYFISGHDRFNNVDLDETYHAYSDIYFKFLNYHTLRVGGFYKQRYLKYSSVYTPWILVPSIYSREETRQTGSGYIQDQMQYKCFELQAGLRFSAIKYSLEDASWKTSYSPRIKLKMFFAEFLRFTLAYGNYDANVVENVFFKHKKYTFKQAGLNVRILNSVFLNMDVWLKDYRPYFSSDNMNYSFFLKNAENKGLDFSVKFNTAGHTLSMNYTLSSFMGETEGPWAGYRDPNVMPSISSINVYVAEDRKHDIFLLYSYHTNRHSGWPVFGTHPLSNLSFSLVSIIASGFPYTPIVDHHWSMINSERAAWYFTTNIILKKQVAFANKRFEFGLVVKNLFDRKNPIQVYGETGTANDPGQTINDLIDQKYYSKTVFDRPYMYGRRRQIDFTFSVFF